MFFRSYPLDGARLFFDRTSGTNVRLEGPRQARSKRRAPRVVQLGLTNRCNLRCSFCFRDRGLASAWTAAEIVDWAEALAAAGVLEIGFGQGEPLLFPGFPALVRTLHEKTPLAVNFTTNGLRLDAALLDELDGVYGQIRLSHYDDNDPLARVRLLASRGARFGVNLLVTPASLSSLNDTVERLVAEGCREVLLLSYNGPDRALHLGSDEDRRLARVVLDAHEKHGAALSLELSVCFGGRLSEVPQIPLGGDCGAGDDFITLDSEKRLLPCSFHGSAIPVSSAAEALRVWQENRMRVAHAGLAGCARKTLSRLREREIRSEPRVLVWQGFASNHSTSYTLVGELPSAAKSAAYVAEIEALLECAARDPRDLDAPPSPTLWRALGREGTPPHRAWEASPMDLWTWRPDAVIGGGRRVLVHLDSTLQQFDIYAHLLFRHHGRIVWQHDYRGLDMALVFGLHVGEGDEILSTSRALGPLVSALVADGPRLYGIAESHEIERVAPILRRFPRSIAITHPSDQALAQALAERMPLPPRKRRTEWMLLRRTSVDAWSSLFARLRENPTAALATVGSHAPFRLPERIEARAFLGGTVLRSVGAPIPGALQEWSIENGEGSIELVSREELRVRVELPEGTEDEKRPIGGLSKKDVEALSLPGGAAEVREYGSSVDIVPKNPMSTFAQLDAMYGDRPRARSGIMAARPLADAVARIDADLDESQ